MGPGEMDISTPPDLHPPDRRTLFDKFAKQWPMQLAIALSSYGGSLLVPGQRCAFNHTKIGGIELSRVVA